MNCVVTVGVGVVVVVVVEVLVGGGGGGECGGVGWVEVRAGWSGRWVVGVGEWWVTGRGGGGCARWVRGWWDEAGASFPRASPKLPQLIHFPPLNTPHPSPKPDCTLCGAPNRRPKPAYSASPSTSQSP